MIHNVDGALEGTVYRTQLCCLQYFIYLFFIQIQEVGLQHAYTHDESTYKYLRKLMALPFLPEGEIAPMFESLTHQATVVTTQVYHKKYIFIHFL